MGACLVFARHERAQGHFGVPLVPFSHNRHPELVSPSVTVVPGSIVQHAQSQKQQMDPETSSG